MDLAAAMNNLMRDSLREERKRALGEAVSEAMQIAGLCREVGNENEARGAEHAARAIKAMAERA